MSYSETVTKKRIALLLLVISFLMGCLILRVTYLQVFLTGWLRRSAEAQRFRAVPLQAHRGAIYDRTGHELAISIDADSIYGIPAQISDVRNTARIIGLILNQDPQELQARLAQKTAFVWIKRQAGFAEIAELRTKIEKDHLPGIRICPRAQRFYPQSFLAGQVLGIAGIDNQGLEGLEKQYDPYLRGVSGSEQAEYDTAGRQLPQGERHYIAPVDGDSLVLTIDQNIQYIVERELEKAVDDTHSKRGMALAVNPQNGEILAVAARPKFDPNHYGDYPAENRRNPLIADMYEPGSTFKVITAAAALEEGKVEPATPFFDPGYIKVGDRVLHCHKPGGHGSENFAEAMENSCNPVFASLALRLTKETFYRYIQAFGFGAATRVDFPGESAGQVMPLARVKDVELATIGFGQGITATPLQMALGVSAVVNGGYLLKPHLVKEIYTPDGKIRKKFGREVVRQVVSEKTAHTVAQLLQSVVTNGSGSHAYLEGYRVAGKTGTAQKVTPGVKGYRSGKVMASFIGCAPADDPQIVTLVILDEPNCPVTYGSVIAAPVVGNIFRDVLRYLGVQPKYEPAVLEKISGAEVIVPNVTGRAADQILPILKKEGFTIRAIGTGKLIYDQIPKPGAKVTIGTQVILYLDQTAKQMAQRGKIMIPDFHGLSLRKVNQLIAESGLILEAEGIGAAVDQEPKAGTLVQAGSVIRVRFEANTAFFD